LKVGKITKQEAFFSWAYQQEITLARKLAIS